MFQTFDVPFSGAQGPSRLAALRAQFSDHEIDGFLVPRSDKYMGEYVAPCDERLAWLTGFTGSAGFAAILPDIAGVFVDGRYRLQVRDQVADVFTPVDWPEITLAGWLNEHAPSAVIGIDPWLHTVRDVDAIRQSAKNVTIKYVPNLVDAIWTDRPDPPNSAFFAQPLEYAGEDHASKRARIAAQLRDANIRAAVLTQPDSIAWLLNIRGADIHHNPVPQSFALMFADDTCHLFCDPAKTVDIMDHLGPDIAVLPQNAFIASLADLDGPVLIDPVTCPDIIRHSLADIAQFGSDPCVLPKARKNAAELQGARDAHLRDAVAMCQFLHWLDGASGVTEIDVVSKLESFRRDTNALRDVSFDTIAGSGPNGAVIHYRVTHDTNRELQDGDLIVVDSGGQYIDGTTDITRTIAIGTVGDDERDCYTRVLQGMIAVSRARFPQGVGGNHLDALARAPLWMAGLDYDHGTGHGVGSFLCVHEGPQGLSRRAETALAEGMILSNEPGYYRAGAFGIRIENLIAVQTAPQLDTGDAHRSQLCFETLTWVPFDRRLINTAMLSRDELTWINSYHSTVLDKVAPNLSPAVKVWLETACAPL